MSAIIKMFPSTSRSPKYLSFMPSEDTEFHPSRNLMGLQVFRTDTLKEKEIYSMSLGTLSTDSYHGLVSINPHLVPHIKNLTLASTWEPHCTGPLYVSFQATRTIDLASIGPILTVYLID